MKDVAQWKEECGCVVNSTNIIKMCKNCKPQFDERHARAQKDYKKSSKEFDEQCERHAREKINPTSKPVPVSVVKNGDLTSLM